MKKAYLVLSDGTVYQGSAFGADAPAAWASWCSPPAWPAIMETLTDPSYAGQIMLADVSADRQLRHNRRGLRGRSRLARGYVVREWCDAPSNFRCQGTIWIAFLKERGVPGICGVDTRAITRRIREQGVMNALICRRVPDDLSALRAYAVTGAVDLATCAEPSVHPAAGEARYRVALVDYGAKRNIVRELCQRGCEVAVVPARTAAEAILALDPDGIMLSNGPGDPGENTFCIAQIAKLLGKKPLFGICLGHQLMALATGARTEKMKYGHRGANQPVRDLAGARTYITSQNHGYAVVSDSVKAGKVRYVNANDGTCEGIDYPEWRAFTVQFHPEASAGPRDTSFLFDRFLDLMGGAPHAAE